MLDLSGLQKRRDFSAVQIPKSIQEVIQRRGQRWFVREEFGDYGDDSNEGVSDAGTSVVRSCRIECARPQGKGEKLKCSSKSLFATLGRL